MIVCLDSVITMGVTSVSNDGIPKKTQLPSELSLFWIFTHERVLALMDAKSLIYFQHSYYLKICILCRATTKLIAENTKIYIKAKVIIRVEEIANPSRRHRLRRRDSCSQLAEENLSNYWTNWILRRPNSLRNRTRILFAFLVVSSFYRQNSC